MNTALLLIATNNRGKLAEYRQLLNHVPYSLVSPADVGLRLEVEEGGATYIENAVKKARAFAQASGLLALADDSGIEVDALDGAPGVRSSRYASSDQERVRRLLQALEAVPLERRTARFRCVVALASPDGRVETFEGTVEGVVSLEPRGTNGFGYDPVFLLPERGVTMAQLPSDEKHAVSHRGQAARKAGEWLRHLSEAPATSAVKV